MSNIEVAYAQANSLISEGHYEAAQKLYIQISERRPFDFDAALQELRCAVHICDWRRFDHLQRVLKGGVQHASGWACGNTVLASPYLSALDLRASADRYAATLLSRHKRVGGARAMRPSRVKKTRMRIGFLGRRFDQRALNDFVLQAVGPHSRTRFEYIAYDMATELVDQRAARYLSTAFDRYTRVPGTEAAALASLLSEDRLDVLVFMQGPTDPLVSVLAHRPAPYVLGYPVYPGPFGALVDGLIADDVSVPVASEADYSEKIWRVSGCYRLKRWHVMDTRRGNRVEHGLPQAACVLAYLGPSYKITPEVFDSWCAILRRFPACVLWLLARDQTVTVNLVREAAVRGVSAERLIFAAEQNTSSHARRWSCADIALDTYPYNAFSNAHDALSTGIPVVTWAGQTMASRVGASLLNEVALPCCIATSAQMYASCIEALIVDPVHRREIRNHLLGERGALRSAVQEHTTSLETIWEAILEQGNALRTDYKWGQS